MNDWRRQLERLVAARESKLFPLNVFNLAPASGNSWPSNVPSCKGLRDFYDLCDGGPLSIQFNWLPLAAVEAKTAQWRDMLHDYHGDGQPILSSERHVVLAHDAGGAPLIWDTIEDSLATFFWKGGGWEPFGLGFEEFMSALFFAPEQVRAGDLERGDLWTDALKQLETIQSTASTDSVSQ
jgi:hypothetical protein